VKNTILRFVPLVLLAVAGALWGGFAVFRQLPHPQSEVATATVRRDDLLVRTFARGELRATRSATIVAPNLYGPALVKRLAPLGSFAHQGDLIVEFDDAEVKTRLEEEALELERLDEQIRKAEADLAIRDNQDQVDLLSAKYSVRRAELEVKRSDFLPALDARKNQLALEEAKRRLAQLDIDVKSRQEQAKAELAVLQEKKTQSALETSREKARLAEVRLFAPISGLVAIKQNRPNFSFPGMQIPDIREGDRLNPGVAVAEILDLSQLEILAHVGDVDRANLKEGQTATIQLDAVPGRKINGIIQSLSGAPSANLLAGDPAKKFDVVLALDMKQLYMLLGVKPDQIQRIQDSRFPNSAVQNKVAFQGEGMPRPPAEEKQSDAPLRPGLLADVEIVGDKLVDAVHIPAQAVFEKNGRLVVYVQKGAGFDERAVTPLKRIESVMVIAHGLEPGEQVALSDPSRKKDGTDKNDKKGAQPLGK
jgi:HlyD family secretion protein